VVHLQVAYKAEWAGKPRHPVDPNSTSQECPMCYGSVPKTLSDRLHACSSCDHTVDRDAASAQVIAWRDCGARRPKSTDFFPGSLIFKRRGQSPGVRGRAFG
jgi:transposase